ncbi:hypothetical protein DRW03_25650 [Corallococcus sp. H22C18031201]|nr:hypothetical protein DRW03_25650 [Corallococcus sp. H22C18031201]
MPLRGVAFEEWALGPVSPKPGWGVVGTWVSEAMAAQQVAAIAIADFVRKERLFRQTGLLCSAELDASGVAAECGAMRGDAFAVVLPREPPSMARSFASYVLAAKGHVDPEQKSEVFFGLPVEGGHATLALAKHACAVNHDGDPVVLLAMESRA